MDALVMIDGLAACGLGSGHPSSGAAEPQPPTAASSTGVAGKLHMVAGFAAALGIELPVAALQQALGTLPLSAAQQEQQQQQEPEQEQEQEEQRQGQQQKQQEQEQQPQGHQLQEQQVVHRKEQAKGEQHTAAANAAAEVAQDAASAEQRERCRQQRHARVEFVAQHLVAQMWPESSGSDDSGGWGKHGTGARSLTAALPGLAAAYARWDSPLLQACALVWFDLTTQSPNPHRHNLIAILSQPIATLPQVRARRSRCGQAANRLWKAGRGPSSFQLATRARCRR